MTDAELIEDSLLDTATFAVLFDRHYRAIHGLGSAPRGRSCAQHWRQHRRWSRATRNKRAEIDVLRREFDAVPASEEATVRAARASLLLDVADASEPARLPTRRTWIRLTVAIARAALVAGILTTVIPQSDRLTRTEIAAAAYRAVTPVEGRIWHRVTRTTRTPLGGVEGRPDVSERWVATSPPYGLRDRSPGWGETEIGPCGSIQYVARDHVFKVWHERLAPKDPRPYDVALNGATDPARQYRHLFRSGRVRYRGETTFQGIAAYRLVVGGPEASITYLVRQDNFYPLRTIRRTQTYVEVVTFLKFEYLPRNARTNQLLRVGRHSGAAVHQSGPRTGGACARFGSLGSLVGR